ncbi:MAG: tetratricopeptide repeat protein [Acidobacteria bacterium]|nr:tetratricopeptide repeat protein [Acidobacteriota bacterium]
MRRSAGPALCVAAVLLAGACAPKTVPAAAVTAPRFPEFIRPAVPASYAETRAAQGFDRGWALLQSGDLEMAERELEGALTAVPAFYPADTALGYLALARKHAEAALPHFDRALARHQGDAAALVGQGQALLVLSRTADALAAFEAAVTADPSLVDVRRRVDVLKFQVLEQGLSRARAAVGAGRLDEAIAAYVDAIRRSPDSPFLYRELAGVERKKGDVDTALAHFRKAIALDPADAASSAQLGEILEEQRDFSGAARAYADALAVEPSADREDIVRRLEAVRTRADLARLPVDYRAIERANQLTRADLAALIGVRLGALLEGDARGDAALITDIRGHWAATWITAVARAGVMEPFSNHAFQPRTVVQRADLAQAAARLLARVDARRPGQAQAWASARTRFADLPPGHLAYPAASMAVAAGVMRTVGENSFQPSRAVTGAEGIDAIGRIAALAGLR